MMDATQQSDNFPTGHTLDAGHIAVAQHQTVIPVTADVAMDHVVASPLVEGTTPGGQFASGRTGNNFHRIPPTADKGVHALARDVNLHGLAIGQGTRRLRQELVGKGHSAHDWPKMVVQDRRAAASSGKQAR